MRIERLKPNHHWTLIWKNFWTAPITMHTRARWYHVIHDILPTNYRLHNIGMAPTEACHNCGGRDTLVRRLIECNPGPEQWEWLKTRIDAILFMNQKMDTGTLDLAPQLTVRPPQRGRAILWKLGNFAVFRTNTNSPKTKTDSIMYLQSVSTRCKTPQKERRVWEIASPY
jgi:hypothetical protein